MYLANIIVYPYILLVRTPRFTRMWPWAHCQCPACLQRVFPTQLLTYKGIPGPVQVLHVGALELGQYNPPSLEASRPEPFSCALISVSGQWKIHMILGAPSRPRSHISIYQSVQLQITMAEKEPRRACTTVRSLVYRP